MQQRLYCGYASKKGRYESVRNRRYAFPSSVPQSEAARERQPRRVR